MVILEWKRIFAAFLLCYLLPLENQIKQREGWDSNNRFNPAIYVCLSQLWDYVVVIFLSSWMVVVNFVYIGWFVDRRCSLCQNFFPYFVVTSMQYFCAISFSFFLCVIETSFKIKIYHICINYPEWHNWFIHLISFF